MDLEKQKIAFWAQRYNAKKRGIGFELTFEEWLCWWKSTGKLKKRGRKKGCYQMGRIGDKGSYRLDNIICISVEDNVREANKRRTTEEMRANAIKGVTAETRQKLKEANTGRKQSEESKRKRSLSMKKRWEDPSYGRNK